MTRFLRGQTSEKNCQYVKSQSSLFILELFVLRRYCQIIGVFSHDVAEAIFVSQNNDTVAMLVSQTSPLGVELFSYANAFLYPDKFA